MYLYNRIHIVKKNELIHAITWLNIKNIISVKESTHMTKYHMILFIWSSRKGKSNLSWCNKNSGCLSCLGIGYKGVEGYFLGDGNILHPHWSIDSIEILYVKIHKMYTHDTCILLYLKFYPKKKRNVGFLVAHPSYKYSWPLNKGFKCASPIIHGFFFSIGTLENSGEICNNSKKHVLFSSLCYYKNTYNMQNMS